MTPTKDQQAQEYAEKKYSELMATLEHGTCPMFRSLVKGCYLDGYTACEQSMWRSVVDEMPEEERLVLAAFKTDGYRTARMAIYSHDYERWISFPGTCTLSNVDFWMPIPPIPDTNTEKK